MEETRRPIQARDSRWAQSVARFLARRSVRPNFISVASGFFAAAAGICLAMTSVSGYIGIPWLFLSAAALMQLRLLCNLFDGMVAIEGGFKTKSGEIFNELPDRFADAFILIGAGYSGSSSDQVWWLGWLAAVTAILTAYVRALGTSVGVSPQFCGPMAKQHRMALMTAGSVACALFSWVNISFALMPWVLSVIVVGGGITVVRRTVRIIRELESR